MKTSCKKHIFLPLILLLSIQQLSFEKATTQDKDERRLSVVVIDPGHGGKDPGTVGGKVQEKDVVLDIALKLGNQIKSEFPEVNVVYTRKSDVFIPLHKRADIANKNNADLFISIHANAVEQSYVYGTETFVLGQHRSEDNLEVAKKENSVILLEDDYTNTYEGFDPNSSESYIMFELVQDEYKEQSISLANRVQNEFRERAMRKDRSVKEAGFLVLRRTTMPSVLIETGFLSNATERNYLNSENGRQNMASAIFRAFKAYKTEVEQKSSFHLATNDVKPQPVPGPVEATKENTSQPAETETKATKENDLFYSVQIAALKKKPDTT
ncbi:MAG: N-acetylmuramoyl-L-alanine amidase, partial [Draconibacterium sp.]